MTRHDNTIGSLLLAVLVLLLFVPGSKADTTDSTDTSLSIDDYVLNGVPAPNRNWRTTELVAAASALADIGLASPEQLPRLESKRSKKLFERITSHDILKDLGRDKIPAKARLQQATVQLAAFRTLAYVYLKGISKGQPYDMEMVAITSFALELTLRTFIVLDQVGREIPRSDPNFTARIEGIVTFKSGLNELVGGALGALAQTNVYGPNARAQLAFDLQRYLPKLMSFLPPIQQTDTRMYLQNLAREETSEIARGPIKAVIAALPPE